MIHFWRAMLTNVLDYKIGRHDHISLIRWILTHFHDWMLIKTNLIIQKTKRVIGGDWCTKITMIHVTQKLNFFRCIGGQEILSDWWIIHVYKCVPFLFWYFFGHQWCTYKLSFDILAWNNKNNHYVVNNELIARYF